MIRRLALAAVLAAVALAARPSLTAQSGNVTLRAPTAARRPRRLPHRGDGHGQRREDHRGRRGQRRRHLRPGRPDAAARLHRHPRAHRLAFRRRPLRGRPGAGRQRRALRRRERLPHADGRLHHGAERGRGLGQAAARGAGPRRHPRPATALLARSGRRIPSSTPDEIRADIRKKKADGADLVKIFASASIRDGGVPTLSQAQVDAACGEAKAQGLRSMVHAHAPEAMMRAARAGCTVVEHGGLANAEALAMLAEKGVWFDPNIGLVTQNYLENKAKFLGIGNYTEEGFASMEKALGLKDAMFAAALKTPKPQDGDGHRRRRRRARPEHARDRRTREVGPGADGGHQVADLAGRRVDEPAAARSAPSRRVCRPTWSPSTATRSPTSPRCSACASSCAAARSTRTSGGRPIGRHDRERDGAHPRDGRRALVARCLVAACLLAGLPHPRDGSDPERRDPRQRHRRQRRRGRRRAGDARRRPRLRARARP